MTGEIWAGLGGAALSGTALPWILGFLWRRLHRDLKAEAEARKLNAEADETIANLLYREIERIDKELKEVRTELASVKSAAETEKHSLEQENKRLRLEVGALRRRVGQLEELIMTKTTPEDMRAQLAEIDRKSAKPSDR